MDRPLAGIKVVELSTFVAASSVGRLLADMGADVVKIERREGDNWRRSSINIVPARFSDEENPIFDIYNAGKKLLSLDIKTEDGQAVFHKLLKDADVFVTNNRDQALKRLHCTYEELKEKYPRLIYAQVTGFGAKGPCAEIPAYDNTAFWARSGFLADSAVIGENGDYNPVFPPRAVGDTVLSYLLLAEINAALLQRTQTGCGQRVEASLYHTGIFTTGTMQISNQKPWGNKYPTTRPYHAVPSGFYRCKDGEYIYIAVGDLRKIIEQLTTAIGKPEMKDDPRFVDWKTMKDHCVEIYELFQAEFLKKDADEWVQLGKELDFAVMKMFHYGDAFQDEQALANDFVEQVTFANGRTDFMPRSPIHMESITDLKTVPAGKPGADNEAVLRSLGYTDAEIQAFKEKNVI